MRYVWFVWSLILLAAWLIVYFLLKKESRREMLAVSLWTMLTGFFGPFFIYIYWNPPSLFHLTQRIGIDIESFIFGFAMGGLAGIIYELFFGAKHRPVKIQKPLRPAYFLSPLSGPAIFLTLAFTRLSPIYAAIIALIACGVLLLFFRSDLAKKMSASAAIFAVFYFLWLLSIVIFYPDYFRLYWNPAAVSGIFIFGIPPEEILYAAAFGFLWSGLYDYMHCRRFSS